MIDAAIHSQMAINEDHLRKSYASFPKCPTLREQRLTDDDNRQSATAPASLAHVLVNPLPTKPLIFAAKKWIQVVYPDGTYDYERVNKSGRGSN
jgi:hypothetical protein